MLLGLTLFTGAARAQNCVVGVEMDAATRTALEATAQRYLEMSIRGDAAGLRQNSVSSLSAAFSGVEEALKVNQGSLAGAQAAVRPPFLLTADGQGPVPRAEFLCGVFGKFGQTSDSAVFVLTDLPPGRYGLTILDVKGGSDPLTMTLVLQQSGADWRLAGLYVRSPRAWGHDGAWFADRAREFKAKAQNHNAWLYYREAIFLTTPVDFMSTLATDKLYDEILTVTPNDMPANGSAVDLNAGGKVNRWTDIFPMAVKDDFDAEVRYSVADISDSKKTYDQNVAIIKAVAVKFPELRDGFTGIVARAVDPSGKDYGTLLSVKDLK